MTSSRRRPGTRVACLAAALIGFALFGGAAKAQSMGPAIAAPPAAAPKMPAEDGLKGGGFYLESDTLLQDDANHRVTAQGAVEVRYKGRVLRADEVVYETTTGLVTAHGHVKIVNADGTAQFADSIALDKDMAEGMATGFSARLADDVKVAAASATRKSADVTELTDVVFTPCPICAENNGHSPTWSIRARKVVENHKKKTIHFSHAVIQVFGVGLFYVPDFAISEPTAQRKSGFLLPVVTISNSRGFSWEQPYYQVISPSADITISPQINSKVNPFLNVDYRQRFYSGVMDIRAGYTYSPDFNSSGQTSPPTTSRSYILGSGVFNLSPTWQWGFTAEQVSDTLIFDKYSIPDVYKERGLYAADDRRLISQVYTVLQDQHYYLSVAAIEIQGLRSTDIQNTFPVVAPLIEGRYEPSEPVLGGRLRIDGSAALLTVDQSPTPGANGPDSRRATLGMDWERTFTLADGLRLAPFVQGRADLYGLSGLLPPSTPNATVGRAFGTIGLNIAYPLIKQSSGVTYILEPMAQIAISPNTVLNPQIPNEDSVIWQFDETNLFQVNRSPGFDLYQAGQNLTLGGRATAFLPTGQTASVIVGRVLQAENDPAVPARTGLQTQLSDYVVGANITPFKNVGLFTRWRLDSDSLATNYLEAGANFATPRATGYVAYLYERDSPSTGTSTDSLDIHGEVFVTKHWGASAYAIVDSGTWRESEFGVVYRDPCLRVEVLYRHNETFNSTLGPSSSVVLRLSLATFGNSGYSR